jgi:acetyl-CoA acetyltransferase
MDTSGSRGVLKAAAAIAAGLCEVAVIGGGQAGSLTSGTPVGVNRSGQVEFTDAWGAYVIPIFALVAQRHMYEFGTTPEQIAAAAVAVRNLGYTNPEAVMFGKPPITVADVLASRVVATPLHLLDCCIAAEGGAAMVLTTAERARDLPHPVVRVAGGGMQFRFAPYSNPPIYREVRNLGSDAMRRALSMAQIDIQDLDVIELYDANSFEVIRQLEILGVCKEGEGGPYVEEVGIGLTAPLPVNTDGGCLAYAWNGTQQQTLKVIEVVRQLRGTAVHQLPNPAHGLAANAASGAGHFELLILGRNR